MGCKACQHGCHPNAHGHHVLTEGQGQEAMSLAFMRWSDILKLALACGKLPDSGEWLKDIRGNDWRVRINALTYMLVTIFKETGDGTKELNWPPLTYA